MSHYRWNLVLLISLLYFDNTIAEAKLLSRSNNHHRCCRRLRHYESTNQNRQSPIKYMKRRRRTRYSANDENRCANDEHNFLSIVSDGSLANNNGQNDRKQQDAIIIRSTRKKRSLAFLSGCNHHLCNNHRRASHSAAAFVSNLYQHPHIKLKQLSSQQSQLSITRPLLPTISTTSTTTTTSLHLKFKTFEEMINHHHSTPLLIDFYSPFCGPCKLMKGEIMSIRHQLDALGPTVTQTVGKDNEVEEEEEEEEDCSVEDVIALSNDCLEDGYLEERQDGVEEEDNDDDGGRGALSSLVKEDTTLLLNDLLPPTPPPTATTTSSSEKQQQHTQSTKQHITTTTTTTTNPSGIPIYHVNTNKFPQVGAKNHIAGLPTLVLFYRGEELWRNEGLMKGEEILNVLIELQEGGWEKKMMIIKERNSGGKKEVEDDVVVVHGEEDVMKKKKKKKRKGRRLGG